MGEWLAAHYQWLRALHIISVIFWMAGLLYLPRLFVYHSKAEPGGELESALNIQERNLLRIIMNPSVIAAWLFGLSMLWANPALLSLPWMHAKLTLVVVLTIVHHDYALARKRFARGERPRTEKFWRIINEIPALGAIAIVVFAVVEPFS